MQQVNNQWFNNEISANKNGRRTVCKGLQKEQAKELKEALHRWWCQGQKLVGKALLCMVGMERDFFWRDAEE